MVQESVPEEVTLELRPESAEGARNSKGWGKGEREREVRPWEMKPEPSHRGGRPGEEPPPAGEGGGKGSAPPPAGRPTRPLGSQQAPGRLPPPPPPPGYSADPPARGGGGGGRWEGPATPATPHGGRAPSPYRGREEGSLGQVDSALRPGPSAGQPFHFSHQFFNRAGAELL